MAELIDYLFLFWFLVAVGTCIVGTIYESHLREKKKTEARRQRRLESLSRVDDWRRPSSNHDTSTSQYNSSHQYNGNAAAAPPTAPALNQQVSSSYTTSPYSLDTSHQQGDPFNTNNFSTDPIRQTHFSHYDAASFESQAASYGSRQPITSCGDQSIPTATGFSSDCVDWVNRILFLFYSQANKYGPIIAENIYRSLNEKLSNILSQSVEFGDWMIEFKSIDLASSTKPELKNVRTENESDRSVSAVCKIYNQRLVCHLKLQRARPSLVRGGAYGSSSNNHDEQSRFNYELTLENLEGKLKSVAMLNDKLIVVQFLEKPDTKILLRQTTAGSSRPALNEDALVSLILQALTQVVVDLYFGDDLEFPQFVKQPTSGGYRNKLSQLKGSANEIKRQIKHDFLGALSLGGANSADNKERKIFVKLVRAKNINYNQNVTCILELEQPNKQQAISSTKLGSNPYWDEHFLFLVNEKSSNGRLTLELWDSLEAALIKVAKQQLQQEVDRSRQKTGAKLSSSQKTSSFNKNELTASGKFLGSAHLSIDELRRNPVQKQTLMLSHSNNQEAPNMIGGLNLSDSIGGELYLELMFLEHNSTTTTTTTPGGIHKSASASSINSLPTLDQGDVVSVDRKLTSSGYLITTTTIAKPTAQQQQQHSRRALSRDRLSPSGAQPSMRNYSPVSSTTEQSAMEMSSFDGLSNQVSQRSGDQASQVEGREGGQSADSRMSRPRSRSRGFLRAIKRRFSFSRNRRSRSVSESASPSYSRPESTLGHQRNNNNNNNNNSNSNINMDAISIDSRSRASSEVSISGRAKSMPASRDSNEVPTIVINKTRLSDASSAFTFGQPKSQLVIECREPKMSALDGGSSSKDATLIRHYAIPEDAASERRWRRRGLKLHVFNEHQFVACHLAGSSTCHLCGRVFSRRPGKQGYKCRNCHLLSHKQCHVKVDHNCPYATKDGLKLEYIDADPPASLVFEKTHSAGSQQQKPSRPTSRLAMKSVSVEVDDR